ncbi:MAG: cysteine desulfurase [Anaerolineae bacterium]|nr:cysteine desulfurase [Anaerolineae bacterium]
MLDIQSIRADFAILQRQVHGKPLVYLDNAATSQKPEAVIQAMADYYRRYNANIHRGVHTLAEEATAAYEDARRKVGRFINARSPREVVFVRNTTEAINLVAYSWGRANLHPGDVVILTEMEHHSNLVPWQLLAQATGARLEFIGLDPQGRLLLDDPTPPGSASLDRLLAAHGERVKLVAVTGMSNVLGTVNPVAEIARRAHAAGALLLVDGAQSVSHLPVDVRALDADLMAFSGHKMLGPTGVGVLWARRAILEAMPPFLGGGDMIKTVSLRASEWAEPPQKFEAGTPNVAHAIGLAAAVGYLAGLGMDQVHAHEQKLVARALERLATVPDLQIYGPPAAERGGVVSFNLIKDGELLIHPHDLASILDREGIAIRAGHHCAQPLIEHYGVPAMARASFYIYNLEHEVDVLVEALLKARHIFGLE